MIRITPWLSLATLLAAAPAMAGDSALVTLASGEVKLGSAAAPSAPFVLDDGQALTLAEGASVVVLHQGTATRLRGPRAVALSDLAAPSVGSKASSRGALTAVLSRDVSFAKAGASRGGDLTLIRPIPGGEIVAPKHFSWECGGCDPQTVTLTPLMGDDPVWTGTGTTSATYDGPALAPGPYLLRVGPREFALTVVDQARKRAIDDAIAQASAVTADLEAQGVSDAAALASIPATVYLRAGVPSEALWTLDAAVSASPDDAALQALHRSYEERLGLREP